MAGKGGKKPEKMCPDCKKPMSKCNCKGKGYGGKK
jgi:hypothetical protein